MLPQLIFGMRCQSESAGNAPIPSTRVTRVNGSTRSDFALQVRDEHAPIVKSLVAGDASAARMAGAMHMVNAAGRIARADPRFWGQRGARLEDGPRSELSSPQTPPKKAGRH